jgi:hypothetical protein
MRRPRNLPRILLLAGVGLLLADAAVVLALRHWRGARNAGATATQPPSTAVTSTAPPATTAPAPSTTPPPPATTAPPPPATTAPTTTQPPPPSPVPLSWGDAGAIIVDVSAANPEWLGQMMRNSGFGWVALPLGGPDGLTPPPADWAGRFRAASGLPVGGWSVLGDDPARDAADAVSLLRSGGLSFYIADAEAPYNGHADRSGAFVTAFRALEPTMPAALSSFCDANGIGLAAWAKAGFAFLPQAYVNDFGDSVSPAACVRAAAPYFTRARVHPMVACYQGQQGYVTPTQFAQLLAQAKTTGFSVFPAETLVNPDDWQTYAQAIATMRIAAPLPGGP